MSGHSKWATTRRHKAVVDAKRGKLFSVFAKELTLAARDSGGNPEFNPRLRTLLNKAKTANMPSENIDRAVKKGTGELPGMTFEELTYEGYGPGGVGLNVEVATDNKNRSASAVRSTFTKAGGNLAGTGALAFNFQKQGQFLIGFEKTNEDNLMEAVLDYGAEDIRAEEDHFEVLCPIGDFDSVAQALERAGIESESSELAWVPNTLISVGDGDTAKKVLRLIEELEELEDVQHVYANYDIDDSILGESRN